MEGVFSRRGGGFSLFGKLFVHFGQSAPNIFVLILHFKTHRPCFQCFVLYNYDKFRHYYIATEIFLIVGYIIP